MELRILFLILTMMGICVTNGAWVGVYMDGVMVVGKTVFSLVVFPDGNNSIFDWDVLVVSILIIKKSMFWGSQ